MFVAAEGHGWVRNARTLGSGPSVVMFTVGEGGRRKEGEVRR